MGHLHEHSASGSLRIPLLGVLLAIGITTAMDATGLSAFSALPLFALTLIFCYAERISKARIGFTVGRGRYYGLATIHPLVVMGILAVAAGATGGLDISKTDWEKASIHFLIVSLSTFLVAILTEEGFFRGWLWASLDQKRLNQNRILFWTSVAFSLWHLSAVVLKTGFDLPLPQVPIFMINAAVLGAIWGFMRSISGSLLVAAFGHGVWNGFAYVFFGYGTKTGALGIRDTALFGPEVGILGLVLNALFLFWLWTRFKGLKALASDPTLLRAQS